MSENREWETRQGEASDNLSGKPVSIFVMKSRNKEALDSEMESETVAKLNKFPLKKSNSTRPEMKFRLTYQDDTKLLRIEDFSFLFFFFLPPKESI